jgi:hypothetical protein
MESGKRGEKLGAKVSKVDASSQSLTQQR